MFRIIKDSHVDTQTSSSLTKLPVIDTESGKPFQTTGSTVFNPTLGTLEVFDGTRWIPMCTDCCSSSDTPLPITGTFQPRIPQLLDDKTNSMTYFVTIDGSTQSIFTLIHNGIGPDTIMNLFVYDESSYFSQQVAPNQGAAIEDPLKITYRSAVYDPNASPPDLTYNNPAIIRIDKDLLPGRYAIRVVLQQSQVAVNYTLTIESNDLCKCKTTKQTKNPFCGFWKNENKGQIQHFLIRERCDGSLYATTYFGHESSGFQNRYLYPSIPLPGVTPGFGQTNIGVVDLEKVNDNVYRYRNTVTLDDSRYFSIDQTNKDVLVRVEGGRANPVSDFYPSDIDIYSRFPNYENFLVDFDDGNDYSSPVKQLDIFTNQLLLANNVQVNKNYEATDFPGYGKMLDYKNQILDTGIIREFEGLDVWPEQTVFFPITAIDNGIQTYAPITLQEVSILTTNTPEQLVKYFNPANTYEVGMTVKLTGVNTASNIGVPDEWLNTYYLVAGLDGDYVLLKPIKLATPYPLETEIIVPFLTVTPYSFKIIHDVGEFVPDEFNDSDAFPVRLSGFSSVGGLDASYINKRHVTAFSPDPFSSFIQIPPGTSSDDNVFATSDAIGGGIGLYELAFYPFSSRQMSLYDFNSCHLNVSPMTTIFTDAPTLSNPYTQIEISGLIGDYSKLNGVHNVHWQDMFDNNTTEEIWGDKFYLPNRKFYVNVEVDSTDLPSFDPAVHTVAGTFTVKQIVRRVTNDSNYGEFAGAIGFLEKILGVQTHGYVTLWSDILKGLRNPSWDSIQEVLAMNAGETYFINGRGNDRTAVGYYNGTNSLTFGTLINELNKNSYGDVPGNPINPDIRWDPTFPPTGFNPIGNLALKYIDNLHNLYASISGPVLNDRVPGSDPLNQNISNDLVTLGANANGTVITYEAFPAGEIINYGITMNAPGSLAGQRFQLDNAFAGDGFVPVELFGYDVILADPLLADGALQADCAGKIVLIRRGNVTFATKYQNAVAAGAVAVIIFNTSPGPLLNVGTNGLNLGVPLYSMSGDDGFTLAGYLGGDANNAVNYTMPTTDPTGYQGDLKFLDIPDRKLVVGTQNLQFGKVRPEFSNGLNIGYIYFPDSLPFTDLLLETLTEFRDIYGITNDVDYYAKIWKTIMETEIEGVRFSNMDQIIMDNSNNTGGAPTSWLALASFFGTDRNGLDFSTVFADNGYSPLITQTDISNKYPVDFPIKLNNNIGNVEATKYQTMYPNATFTGNRVIHLTSTLAFSAGDMYHHFWRNHKGPNYKDIGNGIESIFVGTLDGRLHGGSSESTFSLVTRTSQFKVAPTVNGPYVVKPTYDLHGEARGGFIDTFSKKSINNQLPYTEIDGLNDTGPISAWNEDEAGVYQAFGFSSVYLRNTPQYAVFNAAFGLPDPFDNTTYHYPWLEDAILTCYQP